MKDRRLVFYKDLNEPHRELVRENARMTPEERWEAYIKLRRMYYGLVGEPEALLRKITIARPSWM